MGTGSFCCPSTRVGLTDSVSSWNMPARWRRRVGIGQRAGELPVNRYWVEVERRVKLGKSHFPAGAIRGLRSTGKG